MSNARWFCRWTVVPLVAVVGAAGLAACSTTAEGTGGTPTSSPSPRGLRGADWPGVITDLDCGVVNEGVEVLGTRFGDVRGRGVEDAVVWVDCVHEASTPPQQLEVFDGSSDPGDPRQIAVLIPARDYLLIESVSLSGRSITVDASGYAAQDPRCCPSLTVRRVFTWTGDRFVSRR